MRKKQRGGYTGREEERERIRQTEGKMKGGRNREREKE